MKKLYFFMLTMLIAFAANATTVYFENTGNWPSVCAYAWDPQNNGWPGLAVTSTVNVPVQGSTETKTLYAYTLPGNQANIIFNNNDKGKQTANLKAVDGAVYSYAQNGKDTQNLPDPIGKVSNGVFIPAGAVEVT